MRTWYNPIGEEPYWLLSTPSYLKIFGDQKSKYFLKGEGYIP